MKFIEATKISLTLNVIKELQHYVQQTYSATQKKIKSKNLRQPLTVVNTHTKDYYLIA